MARRKSPEVNAGSMADIAFLLLIFFLVTTTIETDSGINRKLPPMEEQIDPPIIRQKNIFTVVVNKNNQLLVEEELTDIKDLRNLAVDFLDNGGGSGEEACDYCQGNRDPRSSDNPDKAIISLKNAYASDPISAFGGVIACNYKIDRKIALEITKNFLEVVLAAGFDKSSLEILKRKK